MENNTQPLPGEQVIQATNVGWWEEEEAKYYARLAAADNPTPLPEPEHVHGPFVFLLNQNHNALRGCTTCGAAWCGYMAGSEESLCWHPVREVEESQ